MRQGVNKVKEKRCWEACNCGNKVAGNTFYRCSYGNCSGYKCRSCGEWVDPQYGASCSRWMDPQYGASCSRYVVPKLPMETQNYKAMWDRLKEDLKHYPQSTVIPPFVIVEIMNFIEEVEQNDRKKGGD